MIFTMKSKLPKTYKFLVNNLETSLGIILVPEYLNNNVKNAQENNTKNALSYNLIFESILLGDLNKAIKKCKIKDITTLYNQLDTYIVNSIQNISIDKSNIFNYLKQYKKLDYSNNMIFMPYYNGFTNSNLISFFNYINYE